MSIDLSIRIYVLIKSGLLLVKGASSPCVFSADNCLSDTSIPIKNVPVSNFPLLLFISSSLLSVSSLSLNLRSGSRYVRDDGPAGPATLLVLFPSQPLQHLPSISMYTDSEAKYNRSFLSILCSSGKFLIKL